MELIDGILPPGVLNVVSGFGLEAGSKPELLAVYEVWFDLLLETLPQGAVAVEVGAGMGTFAAHARRRRPDL